MDKLQLPHAKLLYQVSELFKEKEIDNQEKLALKEMIISDEPKVFELLDAYQMNSNIEELKNKLIQLVRPEMNQEQNQGKPNGNEAEKTEEDQQNQEEEYDDDDSEYSDDNLIEEQAKIEDPTSPLGNQLFKKKRQRPAGVQQYKGMLQPIKDAKSPDKGTQ